MENILFQIEEDTNSKIDMLSFVKKQCEKSDFIVQLLKYNISKRKYRIHKVNIKLTPITDLRCYRKIVMYCHYAQLAEINHNTIEDLKEKHNTEMLSLEEKETLKLAIVYREQLNEVLDIFRTPESIYAGQSIEELALNEKVAPFITAIITEKYPSTMPLNMVINKASDYYFSLKDPYINIAEQKELYKVTRTALERVCNLLSFDETCYSHRYQNHANAILTKSVVVDIISRYYKGRTINNTSGRVVQKYDTRGLRMRKEIVLVCLEKLQNIDIK